MIKSYLNETLEEGLELSYILKRHYDTNGKTQEEKSRKTFFFKGFAEEVEVTNVYNRSGKIKEIHIKRNSYE